MNKFVTGNIACFVEQLKYILEAQLKYGQCINITDQQEKQLTISISAKIIDTIDIYNTIKDGILQVYIFYTPKKGKNKEQSINPENNDISSSKELIIQYKDAVVFNIYIAIKGIASVSKNLKKQKLELITRLDNTRTLYKFMNKYLFIIDTNGFLYYYPDSISISSINSWLKYTSTQHNLTPILDNVNILDNLDNSILEKYLLLNKYIMLECHLDTNAYELSDMLEHNISSNQSITYSNNIIKPNFENTIEPTIEPTIRPIYESKKEQHNQESDNFNIAPQEKCEKCNEIQLECANKTIETSYSTLSYILSWFNPLAYYSSNSSTTSQNNSLPTARLESTLDSTATLEPKLESPPKITLDNENKLNKFNNEFNNKFNNKLNNELNNENKTKKYNNNEKPSYYFDSASLNCDLIKIHNQQVKILKAQRIELPIFITDINIDNVDNIIFYGKIENQTLNLKYNKYMIGMQLF